MSGPASFRRYDYINSLDLAINEIKTELRPFIRMLVSGSNHLWLADTGATVTVIDEILYNRVYKDKAVLRELPTRCQLISASDDQLRPLGRFTGRFQVGPHEIEHSIIVVKNLCSKAILGADFLDRTGGIVDVRKRKVSFPHIAKIIEEGIPPEAVLAVSNLIVRDGPEIALKEAQEESSEEESSEEEEEKKWYLHAAADITLQAQCSQPMQFVIRSEEGELIKEGAQGIIVDKHGGLSTVYLVEALAFSRAGSKTTTAVVNADRQEVTFKKGDICGQFQLIKSADIVNIEQLMNISTTRKRDEKKEKMIRKEAVIGGSPEFKKKCLKLLLEFQDVVSMDSYDLGRTKVMPHKIKLKSEDPIHLRQFRIPWDHREFLHNFVSELLEKGCIQASRSPYNAPIFCVNKPHGKGLRVVQDFRFLNFATLDDKYVMREISDCLDEIGMRRSTIFSTIDLTSGFWQQALHPDSRPLTAFTVPGRGRFEWVAMPMGLHGAPSSFARLMDHVMEGLKGVITYLDDILTHSASYDEHLRDLEGCLLRLRAFGLKMNLTKCAFAADRIPYLGYTLTPKGVLPGEEKLKAVKEFKPPATVKQVREFTGLSNYFRHMIPNYALWAGQLTKLTRKESEWEGGRLPKESLDAFRHLQKALCSAPVLGFPRPDRAMTLATDAATGDKENPGGLGAVLTQQDDQGREQVIAYASRTLRTHEKNYGAYLLELAAATWAIDHFSVYLTGRRFRLLTDHKPLTSLNTRQTKTLNRLQQQLSEYDFIIGYREGKLNGAPDALSRNPVESIEGRSEMILPTLGLSTRELRRSQELDINIAAVLCYLEKDLLPEDQQQAAIILGWSQLAHLENGIVYVSMLKDKTKRLLWIPQGYQPVMLEAAHCNRFAGHEGVFKTLARLRQKFWWPAMARDVDQFVKNCLTCQKSKIQGKRVTGEASSHPWPVPCKPNERIHADLMGPLRTSEEGNKYILVITDAFSKYTVVAAIKNKEAQTVGEAIFKEWIVRFSCPLIIVTDNGKEFSNKLAKELYKLLGIDHRKTSANHPQTNSAAESFNRSIIKYMTTVLDNVTLDWEKWLGPMMLAYNTRVHKSILTTPFFLTYSMDPRLPYFDLDSPKPSYREDWAALAFERVKSAWKKAEVQLKQVREDLKSKEEDRGTKQLVPLKTGQCVMVILPNAPPGENPKFHQKAVGGYVIIAPLGPVTYSVYNERTKRVSIIHRIRLIPERPCRITTLPKEIISKFSTQMFFDSSDEEYGGIILPNVILESGEGLGDSWEDHNLWQEVLDSSGGTAGTQTRPGGSRGTTEGDLGSPATSSEGFQTPTSTISEETESAKEEQREEAFRRQGSAGENRGQTVFTRETADSGSQARETRTGFAAEHARARGVGQEGGEPGCQARSFTRKQSREAEEEEEKEAAPETEGNGEEGQTSSSESEDGWVKVPRRRKGGKRGQKTNLLEADGGPLRLREHLGGREESKLEKGKQAQAQQESRAQRHDPGREEQQRQQQLQRGVSDRVLRPRKDNSGKACTVPGCGCVAAEGHKKKPKSKKGIAVVPRDRM